MQIQWRHNVRFRYDKGLFADIRGNERPNTWQAISLKAKEDPKVERYDKAFEFNQNIKTFFKLPN